MFAKFCHGKEAETPAPFNEDALPHQFDARRRTSVSAECWNQACDVPTQRLTGGCAKAAITPIPVNTNKQSVVPPSDINRTVVSLRKTLFFKELSEDLMQQVLHALKSRKIEAGKEIICQGDEGDDLYVLDKGKVEYIKDDKKVGEASDGATFGELALMYNAPRAATVRSLEPCEVYTLDRITFKRIMVAKLSRKRLHSQQVLSHIDVFSHLPESTQLKISDALQPLTFQKGDVIIKEGDSGSDFFLIDEGTVEVTANGEHKTTLGGGSYFGELALIYDLPRAATVTATSDLLKLEDLSKRGFEQLIGPDLVEELRRRDPRRLH